MIVDIRDRKPVSLGTKLNPLWWLVGPNGWTAPTINNGAPYLPNVKNQFLRNVCWWCRNPAMNFAGFILGIEDRNYTVRGSDQVLCNTGRDCVPPVKGWRWAALFPYPSFGPLIVGLIFLGVYLFVFGHPFFAFVAAWALLKTAGPLPFINFYNGRVEFYFGWRPSSGGFGVKLVFPGGL